MTEDRITADQVRECLQSVDEHDKQCAECDPWTWLTALRIGAELARRGIDCDPRGVDVMLAQLEAEERVQS
jgi:hypothetical protein